MEEVVLGFTTKPGLFYRKALLGAAKEEGLKLHTKLNKKLSHGTKKGKARDVLEHGLLMEIFYNRAHRAYL